MTFTTLERLANFLIASKGAAYCDDCLASALDCDGSSQARGSILALADLSSFRRTFGRCSKCRRERVVIQLESRDG